jgi:hypothetical protein
MATPHTYQDFTILAQTKKLTIEHIESVTKEQLESHSPNSYSVIYWAAFSCSVEIVEAILDKGVNFDERLTSVSVSYFGSSK